MNAAVSRVTLAVAVAVAATACRHGGGAGAAAPAGTCVVVLPQEPELLNPYMSPMASVSTVSSLFFSGLVIPDEQGRWQPDLAERVPTLANGDVVLRGGGMRVRYRLRRNVRWHDGRPFTGEDVRATWRLVMNPAFPAVSRAGFEELRGVEVPDPHTVVLDFKRPYAPYAELFPYVLPAHVLAASREPARAAWHRAPVGTGPFRLTGWRSGDRLLAVAHEGYFRGRPPIPRLDVRFVPNEATAYQLWRVGEADLLQGAPATAYDALQREAPGRVWLTPTGTWEHLVFNLERPVWSDVRVRRAIAHLVDRQQLNARAYGGVLQPAWSELTPGHWAFDARGTNAYPPDRAAAERLLDEAGWRLGPDGLRRRGGVPLAVTLVTTSDRPGRNLAAQLWRRQWRDLGITLTIERWPPAVVFGSAGGKLAAGAFDLALIASLSRPDPDTSFRWRSDQVPPAGQNRSRYRDPRVDALLARGLATLEPRARATLYRDLAERLRLDLPVIPLLYWVALDATSPRLRGFRPNPTIRGNLWNVWEWKLEPR
ncbi:MAG: peptide ABC transporter substrate-binding protein [Candidatus Sericytochromatia bacterium]|nr:peptide ABC transporter substrate-binding protein [Candidatus Sericytochromatia bacterium]